MIEIPIYCVETEELEIWENLKDMKITPPRPEEVIIRMTINPNLIAAFFEDGNDTIIFTDGQEVKSSLSYDEFKLRVR